MAEKQEEEATPSPPGAGIQGLPKRWATVVQLVGTFGLAVFLVLYYVLVMQPREQARYEGLRDSVELLLAAVESGQSLVSRDQANDLEDLYIRAVAPELARRIDQVAGPGAEPSPERLDELAGELADTLRIRTQLLQGLRREDGGALSEMLTNKIINTGVAEEIVRRAVENGPFEDREVLVGLCLDTLREAFTRAALAK